MRNSFSEFFIRAMSLRDVLTAEEKSLLETLPHRFRDFTSEEEFVREGSRPAESCLVVAGFAARSQSLQVGKRQLTALHVPGDFVDLHSLLLKKMDHSVIALGACTVAFVPHEPLRRITENNAHLTRILWLSTVIDGAIHRTWLTCLGRRRSEQHLAHLLCELYVRLDTIGLVRDGSFTFPATQAQLADLLGMSIVHANRTLQALRATSMIGWQGTTVRIEDLARLAAFAEFDPAYLSLHLEPR